MNRRRLYRCSRDRMLAGVAGGMAEYFDLDPALVRILWVISLPFTAFFSLLLYIVMAIVVPVEPEWTPAAGPWQPGNERWGAGPAPAGAAADAASGEAGQSADATASGATTGTYAQQTWHGAPYGYAPVEHVDRRPGYAAPFFGIALILFGAVALLGQIVPNWDGHVWPLFFLGVGVALIAGSIWRRSSEQ